MAFWSDGTAHITQAAIPPRGVHTYKFTPDHAGTFWYHSHNNGLIDGAYGALIVESDDDPVTTGGDIVLVLSEWGCRHWSHISMRRWAQVSSEMADLSSLENARSVLVNGKTHLNIAVEAGKTYLLRVINAAFVSNFGIVGGGVANKPAHKFSLVMADAHYVEPVNNIENVHFNAFASGQRLTFLFTADQQTGNAQVLRAVEH
jgi:iron transport multicopper oxidase